MPIAWRKQISTGNDLIDQDHKYLLCLFNSIELAQGTPEGLKLLPVFFGQLLDYTKEHFQREERIQLKMEYPGYMEHKLKHQQIITHLDTAMEKLNTLLKNSDEGQDHESLKQQLDHEILSLAREWVIDHLIKTDLEMQPYLKKLPKSFV